MSDGTATYQDLISLKDLAISRIKEKYDIILDSEVRIIYK
jgi:UDP-N-acetylenolpyruvoylglucosamine reductase